jgi:hypothetical protein
MIMKMTTILKVIVIAALLSGSSAILTAQDNNTPACPFGHEPGYGRSLTPEQKAAHRAVAQQFMSELRQKQADGTLTAEERAWLQHAEQRGGMALTGTPRGGGAGKGQGLRQGQGQGKGPGKRHGLRDGTGPRCPNGGCPNGNGPRNGAGR